ncbi:MAG: metallophosphoesterase [Gemmatimonadales bacterium]
MLTLLHASDLQYGRPVRPEAAEALVRFADALRADVTIVSGDLTQRAKAREFRAVRALLERLPGPVLVTPGNHDVPLYRVWERLAAPYRNWRSFVSKELDTVERHAGATFVVLNSSAPHRAIVNGRLGADQIELARRAFANAPPDDVRVLVTHHHFVPGADPHAGPPMPGARAWVASFESMGVDLVLGGHVHHTHIMTSRALFPDDGGPGIPLVSCGTTTSRRGRGDQVGINSLNVIRVGEREIEIVPHLLAPGAEAFAPVDAVVIPRHRGAPVS